MSWIITPSYAPQFPNNPTNGLLWLDTNTGIVWQFSSGTSTWSVNDFYTKARALPSLDLRFAENKSLVDSITGQQLVTFARSSPGGTFTDSAGVLQTAVTNLLLRSEEFGATWSVGNMSISSDAAIAPNGVLTADKAIATSTNATHQLYQVTSGTSGVTYTFSFYVKAGEFNRFTFGPGNAAVGGTDRVATINLGLTNPIVAQDAFLNNSTFVTLVGNGWYRVGCTFTATATGTMTVATLQTLINNSGATSYAGDGTSGLFLWGAQLEQASAVGEYVPTTSTINSAPRFDHRITSSTTNLLSRSEEFDNAGVWGVLNVTVTANTQVAPNGTMSAETLTDVNGVTSANVGCFQSTTLADSTTYAMSCYVKAGTKTTCRVGIRAKDGVNIFANFNLSAVSTTAGNALSSTIQDAGNGWYRCTAICASATGATSPRGLVFMDTGSYTSNGTGTIHVWGAQLEQSATVGPYVPTTTAADTSNTTESLGLLVEEPRTNLALYSQAINSPNWSSAQATTQTLNAATSPDGSSNATLIVENTQSANRFIGQTIGVTNAAYTVSIFAKAKERRRIMFRESTVTGTSATFDLQSGTVVGSEGSPTTSIQAYGNGWYRCVMTYTPSSTSTRLHSVYLMPDSGTSFATSSYTGDGASGLFLFGFQVEAGAFLTSYIPTTTAIATRNADVASITGSAFSSWFRQDEGSFYAENQLLSGNLAAGFPGVFSANNGAGTNQIMLYWLNATTPQLYVRESGTITAGVNGIVTAGSSARVAARYATNDVAISANGSAIASDTSVVLPTPDRLQIGAQAGAALNGGHIRRLVYWPQRLPNPTLQSLTQ